jgi:hypothetical protein
MYMHACVLNVLEFYVRLIILHYRLRLTEAKDQYSHVTLRRKSASQCGQCKSGKNCLMNRISQLPVFNNCRGMECRSHLPVDMNCMRRTSRLAAPRDEQCTQLLKQIMSISAHLRSFSLAARLRSTALVTCHKTETRL